MRCKSAVVEYEVMSDGTQNNSAVGEIQLERSAVRRGLGAA
jgi:hypothetical protein